MAPKDLLYPFALVHLEFYQRCRQALQRAQSWVQGARTLPERRAIDLLATLVYRFDQDHRFTTAVTRLEAGWQAFCELREVLQLSNAELPRADVRAHQRELAPLEARRMGEIEAALREYRAALGERIASSACAGSLVDISKHGHCELSRSLLHSACSATRPGATSRERLWRSSSAPTTYPSTSSVTRNSICAAD